jgi:hypothetical protein
MRIPKWSMWIALVLVVLASTIESRATCLPGECCIEAGCCRATQICAIGETCSCSSNCGQGQASCSCECSGGERVAGKAGYPVMRQEADPKRATPLTGQEVGLTIHNGDISLEHAVAILQNTTRWFVEVEEGVAAYRVSGEFQGDLADVVKAIAASCGAVFSVDSEATTIVFGKN